MSKESIPTYPRWVGLIAGVLLPGSAHYLSGSKKSGVLWLVLLYTIVIATPCIMALPGRITVLLGLALSFVVYPILFIIMLFNSFRPMQRIGIKGWLLYLVVLIIAGTVLDTLPSLTARSFKVPTSAMKPTLRGVTVLSGSNTTSPFSWLLRGETYEEFRATASGRMQNFRSESGMFVFDIAGQQHELPLYTLNTFRKYNDHINEGDLLWSGTLCSGDHVITERISYWFNPPQRGDIVVFKTNEIEHEAVRKDTVYVKRIVGLPGETIGINSPHLFINGRELHEPDILNQLAYGNDGRLMQSTDSLTLGENEYFVLGDNTGPGCSLDSRYFGAIRKESIVGRVRTIYWPFNRICKVQ